MKEVESHVKIYFSSDYSAFKHVTGNRDIKDSKIKKLIRAIKAGHDYLPQCPILVDEDYNIIDGQHRFYLCKQLKVPIHYIKIKKGGIKEITILNSNNDSWSNNDFLNCYCDMQIEDYKNLHDFKLSNHKFGISMCVALLYHGNSTRGGVTMNIFRDGLFKIRYLEKAKLIVQMCCDYQGYIDFPFRAEFVDALLKAMGSGKYDHEEMKEQLKLHYKGDERLQGKGWKEYIVKLEEILNFHKKTRKVFVKH